jgi:putative glutamine amidotransferase
LIGLPACVRQIGIHPFHVVGEKYITAVVDGAGGFPMLLPSLGDALDRRELLLRVDGLLFTGSPSNVAPELYCGPQSADGTAHDRQRDASTLPLIREAIEQAVPLLCICRGIQELNVALGGTLHQCLHEVPGFLDHREDKTQPRDVQYGPAHALSIEPDGVLAVLWPERDVQVNSLHSQGIDRLAECLVVEARSPDGVVEAVRASHAAAFALGIQWHPEWKVTENPFSMAVFSAFGDAARARAAARRENAPTSASRVV